MNLDKENNKLPESDFTDVSNLTKYWGNTTGKISKTWLKETVLAQYEDVDLFEPIDEVKVLLVRARKGEFDDSKAIIHLSGLSKNMKPGMRPVQARKEVDLSLLSEMVLLSDPLVGKSTLLQHGSTRCAK